ncbi:hypothetical protein T310_9802, partial [Rasamsonia emersonii CBS 393.64]
RRPDEIDKSSPARAGSFRGVTLGIRSGSCRTLCPGCLSSSRTIITPTISFSFRVLVSSLPLRLRRRLGLRARPMCSRPAFGIFTHLLHLLLPPLILRSPFLPLLGLLHAQRVRSLGLLEAALPRLLVFLSLPLPASGVQRALHARLELALLHPESHLLRGHAHRLQDHDGALHVDDGYTGDGARPGSESAGVFVQLRLQVLGPFPLLRVRGVAVLCRHRRRFHRRRVGRGEGVVFLVAHGLLVRAEQGQETLDFVDRSIFFIVRAVSEGKSGRRMEVLRTDGVVRLGVDRLISHDRREGAF